MSRITNDTRGMQMALEHREQRCLQATGHHHRRRSPFCSRWIGNSPSSRSSFSRCCLIPLQIFGKRARKAVKNEFEDMGQMVVTMQETFAGIRVIKSFAREEHQEKLVRTEQQAAVLGQ